MIAENNLPAASVRIECVGVFLILTDRATAKEAVDLWQASTTVADRARAMQASVSTEAAFVWNPILDGIFRIDVLLSAGFPAAGPNIGVEKFVLRLPTGLLVLQSATMSVELLKLQPGRYFGALYWNFEQESTHSDVPSVLLYPSDAGPDGRIMLQRMA